MLRAQVWLAGLVLAATTHGALGQAPGQFVEITSLPAPGAVQRVAYAPAPPVAMSAGVAVPFQRYEGAPQVRYQPTTVYRPPLLSLGRQSTTAGYPYAGPVAYTAAPITTQAYPQVTALHPIPVGTTVYSPVGGTQCLVQPGIVQPAGGFGYAPAATAAPYRPIVSLSSPPQNYQVGQGLWGQPKLYMPSQPVRNFLRYLTP